jgi:hypothetical protein
MKHFFAFLLGLLPLLGAAQRPVLPPPDAPVQLARTELQLDPAIDEVQVQAVPADTAVVLLIRHELPGTRKVRYVFQQYGPDLHLRREENLEVPDEFEVVRLCAEPGVVFALFRSPNVVGRLLVAAYSVHSGQVRSQAFETKLCRQVVALKALDGRLLATVTLTDEQHQTVLLLDVASGRFQFLPSLYEPLSSELTSVADRPAGHAEFVLSQTNGRKQRLMLRRLSAEQGELLHSELVQAESERSLLTAQLSPPQDTSARLLAGTYGLRDLHYAQGLFATDLSAAPANEAGPRSALRFYDFRHFRHFFDYLKPAHSARLHDRAARRAERAAQPLRWHYHLLLHELLPQPGGGYTLVAEVYSPQYQYNNYGGFSALGAGFPRTGSFAPVSNGYGSNYGRTFLGFRTSHVLVCGFDKRGNLLWDNSFVVGPGVLRSELEPAVQAMPMADGRLALAYLSDNELHYKRINQSEPGPNDAWVELLTAGGPTTEHVLDTSYGDVAPWANNQYVASGFQRIKVERGPERQVFFLQVLQF